MLQHRVFMPSALFVFVILCCLPAAPSSARMARQGPPQGPPQPAKWSLSLDAASGPLTAGVTVTAVVTAAIDEGWHVYAPSESADGPRPIRVAVPANEVFSAAGTLEAPEPEREMDPAFGQVTAYYTGAAVFRLPILVAAGTKAGPATLKVDVTFQACDGQMCLPPRTVRLSVDVTVAGT